MKQGIALNFGNLLNYNIKLGAIRQSRILVLRRLLFNDLENNKYLSKHAN
jgi:hypothetical protein